MEGSSGANGGEAGTMTTSTKARVKRHRAKLRGKYCQRLEVWIGIVVIENVREVAKRKNVPMWSAVQEALESLRYRSRHL